METMTFEEIHSAIDIASGVEFDTPIIVPGPFEIVQRNQTSRALFDPEIRKELPRLKISLMYCENTVWIIIYAMWELKEEARKASIDFEVITDANHFVSTVRYCMLKWH